MPDILKSASVNFRCTPADKIKLIEAAKESGLTLSEYVNTLISNLLTAPAASPSSIEYSRQLDKEINEAQSRFDSRGLLFNELNEKVKEFETMPAARALFSKMSGQQICFYTHEKKRVSGKVESIQDIYRIVQNLIKK